MFEVGKKLISNTTYLLIAWTSSIILNFAFQLLAAKTLLPEELGILVTAINFTTVTAAIIIFGMEQTTQRLSSYYLGRDKVKQLRPILWFFLLLIIFTNGISIISLLLFSHEISQLIKVPQNLLFISISALLPLSMGFFLAGVLRGYQNMKYLTITAISGDFLKVLFAIFLVLLGYKIFGFLIAYLIATISVFLLRAKVIKLFISRLKIPNIKMFTVYAIPSFTAQLLWLFLLSGQYLIISILQNTYATGLFAVGMILSNQIYFIPKILSDALFPITSRLAGSKYSIKQQSYLLNLALRYSLLVSLPLLFFVAIFPKPLIFLIGRSYFFPAADLVPILVTASLIFGIGTLLYRTLYAVGKTRVFQNISIVLALFYLIISVTLTYLFSALGTAISYLITAILLFIMSLYYLKKYISFKIDFLPVSKILSSSILAFFLLYIISFFTPNLIIGGILTLMATLLYFTILYFLKFYNENEIKILDFLSERIPFIARPVQIVKSFLLKKIKYKSQKNE